MPPRQIVPVLIASLLLITTLLTACDSGSGSTVPTVPPGATTAPGGAPDALARGAAVFSQYCTRCHPAGRRGIGPALIGSPDPDDRIKRFIRSGKANMPPFGPDIIPDTDMTALIAYIRSLK